MIKSINYFGRMLCALLLCSGLALTGCTEEPAPVAVSAITLDANSLELQEGDSQSLTATISPSNADNKKVLWISSNSSVATVAEGVVTAVKAGQATITAKSDDGGKTATCEVTVVAKAILVESVSLDKTSVELKEGEEVSLTATVKPDNATNKNMTWSSSNETVASVTDGKVFALKSGETTITVTTEDGAKTAECKITVKGNPATTTLGKVTAATASFSGHLNVPAADLPYCQVTVYYSDAETFNMNDAKSLSATSFDQNQDFTIVLTNLKYGVKYHYCMVADVKQADKVYGEVNEFTTSDVTINIAYVSSTTSAASFSGMVTGLAQEDYDYIKVGLHYSDSQEKFEQGRGIKVEATDIPEDGALSFELKELKLDTQYYYNTYISAASTVYGDAQEFKVGESLSFDVTVDESSITACTAKINGKISGISKEEIDGMEWGIQYSSSPTGFYSSDTILADEISEDGSFQIPILNLRWGTTHYYRSYAKQSSPNKVTYGEIKEFTTQAITIEGYSVNTTATTAQIDIKTTGMSENDKYYGNYPISLVKSYYDEKIYAESLSNDGTLIFRLKNLNYTQNYTYHYRFDGQDTKFNFVVGDQVFVEANVDDSSITPSSAIINCKVTPYHPEDNIKVGVALYQFGDSSRKQLIYTENIADDGSYSVVADLAHSTTYTYCPVIETWEFDKKEFSTPEGYSSVEGYINLHIAKDLSSSKSANCYMVSTGGTYKFKIVKGNSEESVGNVTSCTVLWESYGTSEPISPMDLISKVYYSDGYIAFQTSDSFKEGNAVIAAKDASGNILWSWHVWLVEDAPKSQVYKNNAGTMMDRNLGAISATPGDVGAFGLKYQWGRKDPFLNSSNFGNSTLTWPSSVSSDSSNGTIEYATAHPTTFITANENNSDWYYAGDSSTDNTRWSTSESAKSIYDPCPAGWRVPDGGENGVWAKACGSSDEYLRIDYEGANFSGKFGSDQTIWYPYGGHANYWSASPKGYRAYCMSFGNGRLNLMAGSGRAGCQFVRCLQE